MREMKDSGIEWIGEIPKDWVITKIKNHFKIGSGTTPTSDDPELWNGYIVWITPADFKTDDVYVEKGHRYLSEKGFTSSSLELIEPGNIIFSKRAPIGQVVINRTRLCTNQGCLTVVKTDKSDVRYYRYVMSVATEEFELSGSGTTFKEISANTFGNTFLPRPSYYVQKSIADYLDERCAKIDAIIEKQQEIIEKLKEYKLSVITEAVTKGLNPDVEMKDSGDNRIGYIPIKWSKIKITRLLDYAKVYPIGDGDHGLIKANNYKEEGIPYIRVQNLSWGTDLLLDTVVYISEEDNERIINSELHPNDILFCKTGATIGKIGIVPHEIKRANTTSHVGKITLDCKYNSRFVFYYLSSEIGYEKFWDIACMKSTRPELSIEEIKSIYVAVPSFREEQDAIVNYLDNICSGIEARKEKVEKMVTKLQDYKKSLIYEVVTGKKEV